MDFGDKERRPSNEEETEIGIIGEGLEYKKQICREKQNTLHLTTYQISKLTRRPSNEEETKIGVIDEELKYKKHMCKEKRNRLHLTAYQTSKLNRKITILYECDKCDFYIVIIERLN
ncbi:uncharacterized protein LOC136030587 [Artemia franciscana]|uniref:uncharacterized protein LOC136030587 n=1 Tax=Artemia franciscana TaxID=6661 RepID=UPI0032DBB405